MLDASAAAAFESLPQERQATLIGLRAVHRAGAKKYAPGSKLADAVKDMPDVEHPVVRTHPATGRKAIYVRDGECIAVDPATGELEGGQDHRHSFGKAAGY